MFKHRVPLLSVLAVLLVFGGLALASRNSGGTYSLPAGNPVVTGTVITSTWANTTLNDIKNEITNSLDRQGRGGMLAPLQLTNGTAAAPSLTFTSEPSSGLYRAGAGDERFSVLTTDVWKWQTSANASLVPLNVTGRTTTTNLTVTGTSASLNVVSTTANLYGVQAVGNGTGNGINGQGGTTSGAGGNFVGGAPNGSAVVGLGSGTGHGVDAIGGASGGIGGTFQGGGSNGIGVRGLGGASNGIGVLGAGDGTGAGGDFTGGDSAGAGVVGRGGTGNSIGGVFTGSGSGYGGFFVGGANGGGIASSAGTAATDTVRRAGLTLPNGDIDFNGTVAPSVTTDMSNRLGPTSFVKAWGTVAFNGAGTVASLSGDGLGIASVAAATNNPNGATVQGIDSVDITFAHAFSSSGFTAVVSPTFNRCLPVVFAKSSTVLTIVFVQPNFSVSPTEYCAQLPATGYGSAGAYHLGNLSFSFTAYGAQ